VKILGDADSGRRCARDGFERDGFERDGFERDGFERDGFERDGFERDGFERVERNDWRGKIVRGFRRIQSNYSQTEYGKNALVVGDSCDGENPQVMLNPDSKAAISEEWI
jgi:hypothetical protein